MVSRIEKLKLFEDFNSFEYKILIIIAIFIILLESSIILVSIMKGKNSHYCYIDSDNNLGESFMCRRNQCSSSDMLPINIKTFIKLKY